MRSCRCATCPASGRPSAGTCCAATGHDLTALDAALDAAVACKGVPTVILADTVKGKGVSFMEGKSAWHGKAIPDAEFAQAMQELGGNV